MVLSLVNMLVTTRGWQTRTGKELSRLHVFWVFQSSKKQYPVAYRYGVLTEYYGLSGVQAAASA